MRPLGLHLGFSHRGGGLAAPVNTALPAVSYNTTNPEVGAVLSTTTGTWTGTVDGFAYQWRRNGVAISGATGPTYQTVNADGDAEITVWVTATNAGGTSPPAISAGVTLAFPVATLANSATMATALNSTLTLTTSAITIADAADRKLVGLTSLPKNETITAVDCSFDGGTVWLPMTASYNPGPLLDGTDYSNVSIWHYDDPPVGSALIRFTRSAASANVRWFWHATVLQNVAAGAPVATGGDLIATNGATFTSTTGPTSTAKNQKLVGIVHVLETTSNAAMFTSSTDTIENSVFGGGNQNRTALIHRNVAGSGAQNSSVTDPDTNSKFANFALAVFAPVPYAASDPIYFVDATRLDDTGDGKTAATAFKTLSALTALPKPPGFTANLTGGQEHRHVATGSRAIDIVANGSSAFPIVFQRSGAGETLVGGDIAYAAGWGAIASGASAYAITNGQQRAMGAVCDAYQAACMDGVPLHPAQWSATGQPSAAGAWDYYQKGSDAVRYAASFQTDAGAALDLTKEIAYRDAGGNAWEVVITHAAIAAHYGANSPVGAHLVYRSSGNQLTSLPITAYDQANSRVTCLTPAGSSATTYKPYDSDPYWAIRFSPFDLFAANQYAWSADRQTIYAVWPAGTDKSVVRQSLANRLQGDYHRLTNIVIGNIMGDAGGVDQDAIRASGTAHSYTDVLFRGIRNPDNTACIYPNADMIGATMTRVDGIGCETQSLFRFVDNAGGTVSGSYARRMGRTLAYVAGTSSGIVFEDLDFSEHLAVHGNAFTVYQGGRDVEFRRFLAMGVAQGFTSQIAGAGAALPDKNVRLKNGVLTGHRDPLGNYSVDTPLIRLDGGDTNGLHDRVIAVLGNSGLYADNTTDYGFTGNDGLVISRAVLLDASINALPTGTTTELRDCLILRSASTNGTEALLAANGVTLTRCTFLTLAAGDIAAGTGGAWNGCPTAAMQEHLTRVTGFNPASPLYEAVQIGPNLCGKARDKGPWTIPAYGAVFSMGALWLSTDEVYGPFQSGKMIGSLCGTMPGSTLSLPGGVAGSANASLGLDRGVIYATAQLAVGVHNLDVDETNAGAVNGPTLRTRIPITVVA